MNRYFKKPLLDIASTNEFVFRKNSFFRIRNDVVQGLMMKSKKAGKYTLSEVFFSIYPLCKPDSLFYQYWFEGRDLSSLKNPKDYWPYAYVTTTKEGLDDSVRKLMIHVHEVLIPFFDKYYCCSSVIEGLPEMDGYYLNENEVAFFALKSLNRDRAVDSIKWGIAQRASAHERNAGFFSPEQIMKKRAETDDYDRHDLELIAFINGATNDELTEYLLQNEENAKSFLNRTAQGITPTFAL